MPDSQYVTLVASTVATVTLNGHYEHIEVFNRSGVAEIFYVIGGSLNIPTDPTVGGASTLLLPAAIGGLETDSEYFINGNTVVKLISTGVPTVNVRGW